MVIVICIFFGKLSIEEQDLPNSPAYVSRHDSH